MIGKTVSHYKILEEIGSGGMGIVYKAEDTDLKRFVALKFLPPELIKDEEAKKRFIHEAQSASALDHSNICTIYEIGRTDDYQMFIAMSCYEGETLKDKISQGPLTIDESIDITIQVANGLSRAHKQGIIHRDIKPANIMITSDGVVKILDFGLAKLSGQTRLTKTESTLGTVSYMSSEQTQGEEVDHRTDIWSLGVVLFEMISGQLPFKGHYEQAVMYAILNEEPEPLTGLRTGVPMDLERIVNKALAKNPDERYQHVADLITDLRLLQKFSTAEQKISVPEKSKSRLHKFMTPRILWTLVIVLFGLFSGVLLFYPSGGISFSERDWILVTDFENHTGDEVFDKSLNTAVTVSIEQSKYINVFPRRRINETLKRMKKTEVVKIDEYVGREIAEREGIKILILPSISKVGNNYVLTGIIQDPISGSNFKTEIFQAQGKDEVLNALDELAKKIRRDLGETSVAISQKSRPLKKVTTSSLDALKQYSLGEERQRYGEFDKAKLYYENACEIDSNFTVGLASIGMLEFEYGDREKGKAYLAKAMRHIDNLTDRENSGIRAAYAIVVENDLEKAIGIYETFIADYPDLSTVHNNLGRVYYIMGRYKESVHEYKEALRTEPTLMIAYNGLITTYLDFLGELDSALVWLRKQLSYEPENVWPYDNLGWAYLGCDSLENAEKAFKHALEINPNFSLDLYRLGHVYRLQGRYQDAIQTLKKILEINPEEYQAHYQSGIVYQLLGNKMLARRHFEDCRNNIGKKLKENPKNWNHYLNLGLVLTRLGKKEQGWDMGQRAIAIDSTQHFGYARLLSLHNKKQEALDELELAILQDFTMYIWMKIHPDFQPLYEETRFHELINRGLKLK